MKHLPVYMHRQEILDGLEENQVIIVESPTGSGKTTQIPLILHEAGYADALQVGITQPRRIATLSVSEFIKKQVARNDEFVGYKMRFEDTTSPGTRIKVMTDGILLMELKAYPKLLKSLVAPLAYALSVTPSATPASSARQVPHATQAPWPHIR